MRQPVVLLVDDDSQMRELLAAVFDLHGGFEIGGVADDGLAGATLAREIEPDVVVLDFFMPGWDGERAAADIRRHCPETRIVAFSAVLANAPEWGDAFVLKNEVGQLVSVCERIVAAPPDPSSSQGHAA